MKFEKKYHSYNSFPYQWSCQASLQMHSNLLDAITSTNKSLLNLLEQCFVPLWSHEMRIRSSKSCPQQIIVANLLNLGKLDFTTSDGASLLTLRLVLKDIQVHEQSATLEALRQVSHCHHNNSSSHFRMTLFGHKGGNP